MVWVTLHLLVDAEEVVLQVKVDRTAQHYEDENARNELISSVIMNYRSMNCDYTSVINFKSMSFVESEEAAQEQTIMESSPSASTSGEQSEGFIETPNVADDSLMVSGDMWTVTNVRRLLTLRLERETQFSQPKNRNMLWKQICDIPNKENVPATPLQCSQKYRNLCTTYRNNKQKMTLR
ncbi:uncharacterized protein LOC103513601 isoform X3 [Diaphorina citri]|uniref:Uncharacterized protein LOC103513601 isoform X3 n=1 Tax=Diaphorina citri TaxID=121845 RepID=A0A3Q0J228_DIACI|nr:uncharacterized protein LOC103513601 isoform X3 [Diaphorina citri]